MRKRSANHERASCTYFERRLGRRFEAAIRRAQSVALVAVVSAAGAGCHAADEDSSARDGGNEVDAICASVAIDGAYIEPDAAAGCALFRTLPCGMPPDASLRGCYFDLETCATQCETFGLLSCQLSPTVCSDGAIREDLPLLIECNHCGGISGRRPMGLVPAASPDRATPGNYFASMAHLEAASVRAFVDLAGWLDALGAPASLAREALRSAQDERRHARVTTRFARRFQATRPRARACNVPQPTLIALLEDNIVEGCVGETFGALLVTWQARHAEDAEIRRALARIAIDETRHAALAWATLAWGIRQLSATLPAIDRHVVVTQLRLKIESALAGLQRSASIPVAHATRRITGHPTPRTAKLLVAQAFSLVRAEAKTLL